MLRNISYRQELSKPVIFFSSLRRAAIHSGKGPAFPRCLPSGFASSPKRCILGKVAPRVSAFAWICQDMQLEMTDGPRAGRIEDEGR